MSTALLQLKLTLVDVKPAVWRRLYVSNQSSLEHLHEIIMSLTGWSGERPHEFVIGGARYGRPTRQEVVPVQNEALFRLHSLPIKNKEGFVYVYDFDAHWEIEVKVENSLARDTMGPPLLLDGAGAFPPEESGGAEQHARLLKALSDATDAESGAAKRLFAGGFDPGRFDIGEENERLQTL